MDMKRLSTELLVSPQISVSDVAEAAAQGIRSIICNRPDGEGADQVPAAEIAEAAARHGIEFRDVPIVSGRMSLDDLADFTQAMATLPGPVLAYCRSGTRSAVMWCLWKAPDLPSDQIIETAAEAGYDLRGLRPMLEQAGREDST